MKAHMGLHRVFNSRIVQNAASLYAVQFLAYLLPLISLPYLARTLEPLHFGLVAFAQSFANWLAVLGEYGFTYSATRSLARQRERKEAVAGIVASVLGAKLILVLGMVLLTLGAGAFVQSFRQYPELVFWALLIAIFIALRPTWYFQAIERAWLVALMEGLIRVGHLAAIFAFVRGPEDAWVALAAQALATGGVAGLELYLMYREVPFRLPNLPLSWVALRVGFSLFLSRASDSLYTSANGMILGLLTTPVQVAFFETGNRLARPGLSILWPLAQAIYPRINHLIRRDAQAAQRLSRLALWSTLGIGLVGGAFLAILAPYLIRLLFGEAYETSVRVLQVLSLLLPIVAFGYSLSMQYMFPRQMDREVMYSVLSAGLVNLALAALLAPRLGALGMAFAVVAAEAWAALFRFFVLKRKGVL
ncbi:flippase [Meiothermus sp. QL-1]|uniref:oligosaccharide flippase family protein n=1 Tax=Meiothermus sp. QL-1 TaxID=2058095 RepID=UPI000E0AB782|nr:oligosaccharide flippase family protein [Meiothermus sp. QL-1]RDI95087.1 flippase [Meiothermus sp. QL-1]